MDASVVVAALTDPGPVGIAAQEQLDREVIAPELLDVEVLHAVRRLVRTGTLSPSFGERALASLANSPIERVPHRALLRRAWELRDNLSAYDATYVALAEMSETALLTGDAAIAKAPGIRCAVHLLS